MSRLTRAKDAILVVAILNFLSFVGGTLIIGGDALSGRVIGSHYYVSSHGRPTEVSAGIWRYSRTHAISVTITHPTAIIVAGGLDHVQKRRQRMAKPRPI